MKIKTAILAIALSASAFYTPIASSAGITYETCVIQLQYVDWKIDFTASHYSPDDLTKIKSDFNNLEKHIPDIGITPAIKMKAKGNAEELKKLEKGMDDYISWNVKTLKEMKENERKKYVESGILSTLAKCAVGSKFEEKPFKKLQSSLMLIEKTQEKHRIK